MSELPTQQTKQFSNNKPNLKATLLWLIQCAAAALVLEACTLFGSPQSSLFDLDNWSRRNLVAFFFIAAIVSALYRRFDWKGHASNLFSEIRGIFAAEGRKILLVLALSLMSAVLASAIITVTTAYSEPLPLGSFLFALFLDIALIAVFHRSVLMKFEYFFVIIALGFGLCFCAFSPHFSNVSWDDQIHYSSSESLSYLFTPQFTDADRVVSTPTPKDSDEVSKGDYSLSTIDSDHANKDALATDGEVINGQGFISVLQLNVVAVSSFGYIPSAIGLWLARLLHVSFTSQIFIGRLFNLLFYIGIIFMAIRKLKSKKILAGCVGLIPTSLFMASNFSYDPWFLGLTIYGFSYCIALMQDADHSVTVSDTVKMLAAFLLGLGPKAVCFPFILILLIIPKERFNGKFSKRSFTGAVLIATLIALALFGIPILFNGAPADVRMHSDINPTLQLSWIFAHFSDFLSALLFNMLTLIVPRFGNGDAYTSFAYCGGAYDLIVPICVFLFALCFLDVDRCDRPYARLSKNLITLLFLGCSLAFINSALYLTFNPVGANTFEGVQNRYILGLVFPALAIGLNFKIPVLRHKNALAIASLSCSIFFLYATTFLTVIYRFVA